mmetsp:Transcript_14579/g.37210  ORF Transcript_14579/g.37210 Transcript_14579/m.37210 type:complete len:88 (+) Transcript_14579:1432-1695(+)
MCATLFDLYLFCSVFLRPCLFSSGIEGREEREGEERRDSWGCCMQVKKPSQSFFKVWSPPCMCICAYMGDSVLIVFVIVNVCNVFLE